MGEFNQLLRPLEDFTWKKTGVRKYSSTEKHFYLTKEWTDNGPIWYWHIDPSIVKKSQKSFVPIYKKEAKQKGYSSWMEARDTIVDLISAYIPDIKSTVSQEKKTTYHLYCQGYSTGIRIKNFSKWEVVYPLNNINTLALDYTSRYKLLQSLYQYVENNLPLLYFENQQDYQAFNPNIADYPFPERSNLWWVCFIKPEVDLTTSF